MLKLFFKIIPAFIFWGIFAYVIFQIPYPNSLTDTTALQLLAFFMPLFLAVSLTINIFFKKILLSSSISLGIILLLVLKALDSLNLVTGTIIVIAVVLLVSYFRKIKKKSLTIGSKIPRLTSLQRKQ